MVVAEFWRHRKSNQLTISFPGEKTCQIGEIWYQLRVASRHFKIQGLQVNVHCSRNRLTAITKLSWMNAGQNWELFSDSENVSKGRKLRWYTRCVCSWCGVNFKISVPKEQVYFGRKELKLTKFAWQTFWKYLLVLNWIPRWKMFRWTRNSFFLLALNTNPPKQEADRLSESKQSEILLKYYFGLSREAMNCTFCHSSCQRSAMLWTILSLAAIRCCRCWSNLRRKYFSKIPADMNVMSSGPKA